MADRDTCRVLCAGFYDVFHIYDLVADPDVDLDGEWFTAFVLFADQQLATLGIFVAGRAFVDRDCGGWDDSVGAAP